MAKKFEEFLPSYLEHYLVPAEDLAIFIGTHSSDHVILLLANNDYSHVSIVTKDRKYVGTINITNIMSYQAKDQLTDWELARADIGKTVNTKIETISETSNLTDIIHPLVDYPFLPVLDKNDQSSGIITCRSILKAVNSFLHDFTDYYTIAPKND